MQNQWPMQSLLLAAMQDRSVKLNNPFGCGQSHTLLVICISYSHIS